MKTPNFSPNLSLSFRIRMSMLRGVVKILAWAIAPALKSALRPGPANAQTGVRTGDVIDGEYRRLDTRHNDRC